MARKPKNMITESKHLFDELSKHFKEKISKKFGEEKHKIRSVLTKLSITGVVKNPNLVSLNFNTDESYFISAEHDRSNELKATITSDTFFGLRHGLETLSQLIVLDDYENVLIMPWKVHIMDKPAFPYRALTLDTSRNFISVNSIKRTIDAMAANKLNIFHWHLTDTHSFPIELPSLPQLAKFGAYGPDKVYKVHDVKDVVEYAKIRGVKVVPEFDAPAHVGYGWQWTRKPVVVCLNEQPWSDYCVEAPCGQFDPTQELLYDELLPKLYEDMFNLFGVDSVFHMGGDEVHFQCWNKTKHIVDWMSDRGWNNTSDGFLALWNYFQQRALEIIMTISAKLGKTTSPDILLWTSHLTTGEPLDKYLDQNKYIIQIWTTGDDPNIKELITKGYKVVFSNYDALYLDCGFGSWISSGNNWCSPYKSWQTVYMNDPIKLIKSTMGSNYTTEMRKQILGQAAALWTEQVDDVSIDSRLWPRSIALAERTWTNPETDWKPAEYRFLYQQRRLIQLGVAADGQEPLFCSYNEGSCPDVNH